MVQLLLAFIGLLTSVFVWWVRTNDIKAKRKAIEDAKIDACRNADDVLIELDRLRNRDSASSA